jgi:acyl-CoA synthetase (NDP forming)
MSHRLTPLLEPASIAVLGATERAGTVGRTTVENLLKGGYAGRLYPVNPGYATVCGVPCFPTLAALPERVEHVIFAVGDARVEGALEEVIAHGARAATLMSSLYLADDGEPSLQDRVAARIRACGLVVCGGNGMGFYNFSQGVWACGFQTRQHGRDGNIAFISHSGSGMCGIVDTDERLAFNLVVSTGQELAVAMHDYLDYALELASTRVVGLFMETARDPEGLRAALEKANRRRIPVVALKVGRTELAAKLTVSHTGAIAGRDGAYQALFDRYGVHRVDDLHELATTLAMFAQPHPVGAGGLVSIHDSGGERQLLIDAADRARVPLTELTADSTARLASLLDPGLPAVNPLDAWSTGGPDYHVSMQNCFATLMADPGAALGAVVHDRVAGGGIHDSYIDYLRAGHTASGKPAFLVANTQGTGADPQVVAATREGFPVLDGLAPFLRGVRALLEQRDFVARAQGPAAELPRGVASRWQQRLRNGTPLDEHDGMQLLRAAQLPGTDSRIAVNESEVREAARALGYPLVLKTAMPGIEHKSDVDGVRLALADEGALLTAYRDVGSRLGPRVLVAPMIAARGIEMLLGAIRDEQFGPVVLLGSGGLHVEALADVAYALPPFDAATARRLLDRLQVGRLLTSRRHARRPAIDEFCAVAARFSTLVAATADVIREIDLNPVIVHADGCTIVDALIVPADTGAPGHRNVRIAV